MRQTQLVYLETKQSPKSDSALASIVAEHWQSRHLYGKALFVCNSPDELAKLLQKRWTSAMQAVQQERARTIDADKLLNITHAITRMQQMVIADMPPHGFPAAHFWVIAPTELEAIELPRSCHTIYIASPLSSDAKELLTSLLPAHSLIVDLASNDSWDITPKTILEEKVYHAWNELTTFLAQNNIDIQKLVEQQHTIDAIDDALDTLLDTGNSFLRHARQFQEVLHLAQPMPITFVQKQQFELANMLARRVAILTPGIVHHSLIQTSNDTFSLYDAVVHKLSHESLAEAVARHAAAGRMALARALKTAFINNAVL